MILKVGSTGQVVSDWQAEMLERYPSYAKAADGGPLKVDGYFGYDDEAVQVEYEFRTGQPIDREVSQGDLDYLGIKTDSFKGRWLFTVHGTGMADPFGPGLPADTARDVEDIYDWQPIGNYPAAAFPMWPSITKGVGELRNQIASKPGEINMAGYSQGAVVCGQVLKHDIMSPSGSLHHRLKDVRKVVFWGNPMRQQGIAHTDEWIHPVASPSTMGILEDRLEGLEDAPFEVRDYAHEGDMYASIKADDMHEYEVAIGRLVMNATDFWKGKDSLVSQLLELHQRPLSEGIAVARAIIDAMGFLAKATGPQWPHLYNRYPAVAFLRS
ncbi:lysin B [Mycobacterium phage Timshel]|uniref:Lysin B n=1 Tax=Mycobacterium phage Timshel TaxID=1032895 RepID=G1DB29_9CAUD|nr:lysin B [Mycobacterium phage Timshel]AEJ92325.1 lysin B [Mycobacterium phage Timshel]